MAENKVNDWRIISIIILIVVIVFAVIFGIFGSGMGGDGMMGFGWLFMLLPVILIILLVLAVTDRNITARHEAPDYVPESAMQILERRYANGKISRDEYLKIKEDILGE